MGLICATCPWHQGAESGSVLSTASLQGWDALTDLWSLLQPLPALCLSSSERCSSPLLFLVVLPWTVSSISMLGAQHWTQHSRTEQWGRILSLLTPAQTRTPFTSFTPRTHGQLPVPKAFSTALLSSWTVPGISQSSGIFLPRSRAFNSP